jgi:uncharacterized phiE125 gp8 family phage protein
VSRRVQTLVAAPASLPVSVDEAKKQARIYHDDDNSEVERIVYAATASVEQYLQRKLITQTWKMFLDSWPLQIKLLFGDLQSVTHVKYTDSDEVQSTVDSSTYSVDTDSVPGRVVLLNEETWPTDTLSLNNPIEVQFVTGYGDASTDVPQDIRHAILLLFSYLYTYREDVVLNNKMNVEEMPFGGKSLLYPHRIWDWII